MNTARKLSDLSIRYMLRDMVASIVAPYLPQLTWKIVQSSNTRRDMVTYQVWKDVSGVVVTSDTL